MFTFIHFSQRKELTVSVDPNSFKTNYLAQYKKMLKEAGIHSTEEKDETLTYIAPLFRFAWNGFNLMNCISKGDLSLTNDGDKIEVRYSCYFIEIFIIALLFSSTTIALFHYTWRFVGMITAIWGIYYLGSVCLTIYRYNRYITGSMKDCYLKCLKEAGF